MFHLGSMQTTILWNDLPRPVIIDQAYVIMALSNALSTFCNWSCLKEDAADDYNIKWDENIYYAYHCHFHIVLQHVYYFDSMKKGNRF